MHFFHYFNFFILLYMLFIYYLNKRVRKFYLSENVRWKFFFVLE